MDVFSTLENVAFSDDKPVATTLLKSNAVNELRISMKKGQLMKAHKAPYLILVSIIEGMVDFGIENKQIVLKKGDVIHVPANVIHDLTAIEQSVVRVSLIKC